MCDSAPAGGIIPSEETFTEATLTLYVWTFCRFCFGRKGNQRGPKSVDEWSWGQPWRDRTCQGVGLTGRWKCMKRSLGFPSILYFDLTNSCSVLLQALQCRIEVQQDISFSLCYVFVWCFSCGYDTVPFESLEGWHLATCAGDRAALPRSPVMQAAAPAAWWELVTSVAQLCVGSWKAPLLSLGHKVRVLTRRWRIDEEWQEHIEVWRTASFSRKMAKNTSKPALTFRTSNSLWLEPSEPLSKTGNLSEEFSVTFSSWGMDFHPFSLCRMTFLWECHSQRSGSLEWPKPLWDLFGLFFWGPSRNRRRIPGVSCPSRWEKSPELFFWILSTCLDRAW